MSVQLPNGQIRSADLVYQNKHHGDMVFNDRYYEKFAIWNDDCDGLIWEKEHDDEIILVRTVWYPGSYSNNVSWTALFHPKEGYMSYPYNMGEPGSFQYMTRTKDFGINGSTGAYDNPYGAMRVSKNGIDWTVSQRCPGYRGSSWSIKENIGINYGRDPATNKDGWHRLELDDNGKLTDTFLGNTYGDGSRVGELALVGTEQDGVHTWHKVLKPDGTVYVSKLPATYTWINRDTVVTAGYNWQFYYLNGKYIAVEFNKYEMSYQDPISGGWVTLMSVLLVESDDGFKTVHSVYLEDPKVGGHFSSANLYVFDEKFWIWENGYDVVDNQRIYYYQLWEYPKGSSYRGTPTKKKFTGDRYVSMPIMGMSHDSAHDTVNLILLGSKEEGYRETNRSVGAAAPSGIYFKDGEVTNPYGYWVFPTTFVKNSWSSNAWNRGGFMVIKGDMTNYKSAVNDIFPDKNNVRGYNNAFAVDSWAYMLDPDNATDGTDSYRIYTITNENAYSKCDESEGRYEHVGYYFYEEDTVYGVYRSDLGHVVSYFAGEVIPTINGYIEIPGNYNDRYLKFEENKWNNYYTDFHLDKHLSISEVVKFYPAGSGSPQYLNIPLPNKARWLKHENTVFDMRNDQYYTDSAFYSGEDNDYVTSINGSDYLKENVGQAYTFAVYTLFHRGYNTYGATTALIISLDEPVATMNAASDPKNTRVVKYDNKFWYYQSGRGSGLWPAIEGYYPSSMHFIDLAYMGEWPSWDAVALKCLEAAHPVS